MMMSPVCVASICRLSRLSCFSVSCPVYCVLWVEHIKYARYCTLIYVCDAMLSHLFTQPLEPLHFTSPCPFTSSSFTLFLHFPRQLWKAQKKCIFSIWCRVNNSYIARPFPSTCTWAAAFTLGQNQGRGYDKYIDWVRLGSVTMHCHFASREHALYGQVYA